MGSQEVMLSPEGVACPRSLVRLFVDARNQRAAASGPS